MTETVKIAVEVTNGLKAVDAKVVVPHVYELWTGGTCMGFYDEETGEFYVWSVERQPFRMRMEE